MQDGPLKIDLGGILNKRLGRRARWVPSFVLHGLERLVRQDELNAILEGAWPEEGSGFSKRVLDMLEITLTVEGLDKLPEGESFVFACNHPLGGLDGIALVGILGERFGDEEIRVLVNDMLMNVEPLRKVFLPVNKYGSQGRDAAKAINEAYAAGKQIVMFPAGLVSRRRTDGSIRDLEWQKSCVVKALATGRRIVPVRFDGLNSRRFYNLAYWRKRLGIKINLEQALLPGEVLRSRNAEYRINFGKPVDPATLRDAGESPAAIAARLRDIVYTL
ncbi:MAG: 1-acyl-sn-glycerol-3-phosphate acyltransferase [Muribaculaceae bacterium]|nr:1-acyl-sn-glycerol-3-phosphate acyltransferase [Muribaculaceae bacterium]